jgi:hypothetical protein
MKSIIVNKLFATHPVFSGKGTVPDQTLANAVWDGWVQIVAAVFVYPVVSMAIVSCHLNVDVTTDGKECFVTNVSTYISLFVRFFVLWSAYGDSKNHLWLRQTPIDPSNRSPVRN